MNATLRRAYRLLLAAALLGGVASTAEAGEWLYRLYGYQPRVYGSFPSQYVFPRYGFKRGYVYFEGPAYGSPMLDDPCHVAPAYANPALPQPPAEEPELIPAGSIESSARSTPATVKPALARKGCFVPEPKPEKR